jgi:hypothetical protein
MGGGADPCAAGGCLPEQTVTAQNNSFSNPLVFDPTTSAGQFLQMANRGSQLWTFIHDPEHPYWATPAFHAWFDQSPIETAVLSTMLMIQAGSYPIYESLTGAELQLPGGDGALYNYYTVGDPNNPIPGQRIANISGSNIFYYAPYHTNPGLGVPNGFVQFILQPN